MDLLYIVLIGVLLATDTKAGEFDVPVKYILNTDEYYNNINNTIVTKYLNTCSILISPQPDVFLAPLWINEDEPILPTDNPTIPTLNSNELILNWEIQNYGEDGKREKEIIYRDTVDIPLGIFSKTELSETKTTTKIHEKELIFEEEIKGKKNFHVHVIKPKDTENFKIILRKAYKEVEIYFFEESNVEMISNYNSEYGNCDHSKASIITLSIKNSSLGIACVDDTNNYSSSTNFSLTSYYFPSFDQLLHQNYGTGTFQYKLIEILNNVYLKKVKTLTSPWLNIENNTCVSMLVYKPPTNDIKVFLQLKDDPQSIELKTSQFIQTKTENAFQNINSYHRANIQNKYITIVQVQVVLPQKWEDKPQRLSIDIDENVFVKYIWQCPRSEFLLSNAKEISCSKKGRKNENQYAMLKRDGDNSFIVYGFSNNRCLNGGILIQNFCVCPPGFAGEQCEISCGENNYGKNCLQKCSGESRQCEGVILCMPYLGCSCASGYTGDQCLKTCSPGLYGADCKEHCGHCKGSCDPYTGHCTEGCTSTYLIAPFCKTSHSYFKNALTFVEASFDIITLDIEKNIVRFEDNPMFYMVQYKMQKEANWRNTSMMSLESPSSDIQVKNLNTGETFDFRAILFDKTLKTHDPNIAEVIQATTKCLQPEEPKLFLSAYSISSSSIILNWEEQERSKESCKTLGFVIEIKNKISDIKLREIKVEQTSNIKIENLLPNTNYELNMRIVTIMGEVRTNTAVNIRTKKKLQEVNDFIGGLTSSIIGNEVFLKWIQTANEPAAVTYYIKYKLEKRLACIFNETVHSTLQTVETSLNYFYLSLEPFSLYQIFVTENKYQNTSKNVIQITTDPYKPTLTPSAVTLLKTTKTEAHLKIIPSLSECEHLNGFFRGYVIDVFSEGSLLYREKIGNHNIVLRNLLPSSVYEIHVEYFNHIGVAVTNEPFTFKFYTKSADSLVVQDLTAYKTSKNLIGLRWKIPHTNTTILGVKIELEGQIENQIVNISKIESLKCNAWPTCFCFDITHLKYNRTYVVKIVVLNDEYPEGGDFKTVTAITRETISSSVRNINFLTVTENSVTVQWNIPSVLNGILRKFTLEIEHIAAFDENLCCQSSTTITLVVNEEIETYSQLINNLQNASTYQITIKPFTRKPGMANSTTVHTVPPILPVKIPNIIVFGTSLIWENTTDRPMLPEQYDQLISDRLIIVQPNFTTRIEATNKTVFPISHMIDSLLNTTNWWIAHVCLKNDDACSVNLGTKTETDSEYGKVINKALEPEHNYSLAVIQINTYETAHSYSLLKSEPFQGSIDPDSVTETTSESLLHTTEESTATENRWDSTTYPMQNGKDLTSTTETDPMQYEIELTSTTETDPIGPDYEAPDYEN